MPKNGRGRQHAAMLIANADSIDVSPLEAVKCAGTTYHVAGSPFGGFSLVIGRNWDTATTSELSSAHQVGWIDQKHVWVPTYDTYEPDDTQRRSDVDKFAHNVRPPGVTSCPEIAVCEISRRLICGSGELAELIKV